MLLLHHALFAPVRTEHTGDLFSWGMRDPHTLNLSPAARFTKIGALDGTCTHTLPADNGLLFYSATRAKWWEVLVTLQFVASDFVF